MTKLNDIVFTVLKVIAWIIFVGLCIESGGLIVNFLFSIFNPDFVDKLYQKLDLSMLYKQSKWAFFSLYSFALTVSVLKAIMFYIVIEMLQKLDLRNPFSSIVAHKITVLSYYALSIGILSFIAKQTGHNMEKHGYSTERLNQFWVDSDAFIIMAAVGFFIAQIFKRGVYVQQENDLTV